MRGFTGFTAAAILAATVTAQSTAYFAELITVLNSELVYLNRLDRMRDCVIDTTETVEHVVKIAEALKNDDEFLALEEAAKAAHALSGAVLQCTQAEEEALALSNWYTTRAGTKDAMIEYASANTHLHAKEIESHVEDVWATFFSFTQPIPTGKALGNVAYWALGPIEPISDPTNFII